MAPPLAGPVALLTGGRAAEAFRHYPVGDVYDLASHAQFYYHTHRAGEFGHIHLFQRPKGMPPGLVPAFPPAEADAPCHLIAVGFDARGQAAELFTTNRWVTGEAWYGGEAVKAMVAGLRLGATGPAGRVAAWLLALVRHYQPLIGTLVEERDRRLAEWAKAHPGIDPLDDERLDILSSSPIDPPDSLVPTEE